MFSMQATLPDTNHLPDVNAASTLSLARSAADFAANSRASSTMKTYRGDWLAFTDWCREVGADSLPATPATVAAYLACLAVTHKPATMTKKLAAISSAHKLVGFPSPTTSEPGRPTFAGIRRKLGTRQRQVMPLTVEELRKVNINLATTRLGCETRPSSWPDSVPLLGGPRLSPSGSRT
jgi:hypothetical protein